MPLATNTMRYGTDTFAFYQEVDSQLLTYDVDFKIHVDSIPTDAKIAIKLNSQFYRLNKIGQLEPVYDPLTGGNTVGEINSFETITALKKTPFKVAFVFKDQDKPIVASLLERSESALSIFTEFTSNIMTFFGNLDYYVKRAPKESRVAIDIDGKYYKIDKDDKLVPIQEIKDEGNTVEEFNEVNEIPELNKKKYRFHILAPGDNAKSSVLIEIRRLKDYIIEWFRDKEGGQ